MSNVPQSSSAIDCDQVVNSKCAPSHTTTPVEVGAPPTPNEEAEMLRLFRAQSRQCWICERIAKQLEEAGAIAEEDKWHFTTCVMSWDKLGPT